MAAKVDIEHFDKHPKLSLNQVEPKGRSVKNYTMITTVCVFNKTNECFTNFSRFYHNHNNIGAEMKSLGLNRCKTQNHPTEIFAESKTVPI